MLSISKIKLKILTALICAAAGLGLAGTAQAATYYVAPNGNDSNPGTMAQPWATLNKANSVIAAGTSAAARGDTVMVRGGTYTFGEQTLTKAYTTWQAYPGETPVIDGVYVRPVANPTTVVYSALVSVQMAHGLILDGFTIKRSTGRCLRVFGNSESDRINGAIVRNCVTTDAYDNALLVTLADGVMVENTEVARGSYEVFFKCNMNWTNCVWNGVNLGRVDPSGACVTRSVNSTFRRMLIHDNYLEGFGDYICNNNNTIENSVLYGNYKTNIYIASTNAATVRHNLIYGVVPNGNGQSGYFPSGIEVVDEVYPTSCAMGMGRNHKIYGNVVANCSSSFWLDAQATDRPPANNVIRNNTFLYPRGDWNVAFGPNSGTGHEFRNNLIIGAGTSGALYSIAGAATIRGYNEFSVSQAALDDDIEGAGDTYSSIPVLSKTSGWDALTGGGLSKDDFRLMTADNGGISMTSPYNIDAWGTVFDSTPDRGAHQFISGTLPDTTAPAVPSGLAVR